MFDVISPDGLPMTFEPFPTKQEAIDAIPRLCALYAVQGYYCTARFYRIPLEELPYHLTIVEV